MADKKSDARRILDQIAASLGTSVSTLYYGSDLQPQLAQQAAELIRSFEMISDAEERQACLDFVRSIAARQQQTS